MKTFFVSPTGTGDGSGEDPAPYQDNSFWQKVKDALDDEHITVHFLGGEYRAGLPELTIGHPEHQLILQGSMLKQTVFVVPRDIPSQDAINCLDRDKQPPRIPMIGSENVHIRQLHFTGAGSIGFVIRCWKKSHHISIEDCTFINMPGVIYGAIGVLDPGAQNVTVSNCRFQAIGCDGHAHMMYNTHHIQHILIKDCHFEECAGDYIRFRDDTDHCVVQGCVFKSTGIVYDPYPFLSISVFNDCKPGSESTSPECSQEEPSCPDLDEHPQYEYFGSNFVFAENEFIYESSGVRRFPIAFIHVGWDPPRRSHLLTADEGNILRRGSTQARKRVLERNCGIDTDRIIVYGNRFQGTPIKAAFESYVGYCATSERWNSSNRWEARDDSAVEVFDLLNPDSVRHPSEWLEPVLHTILHGQE
jgi:hypothetical protein